MTSLLVLCPGRQRGSRGGPELESHEIRESKLVEPGEGKLEELMWDHLANVDRAEVYCNRGVRDDDF